MPRLDLTGQKFERWTAIEFSYIKHGGRAYWWCRCDCGTVKEVSASGLVRGQTKSCGCFSIERARNNKYRAKHHMTGTPIYVVWTNMLKRCRNPNNKRYSHYGGRGIKVCERWHTFESFYADMGDRPQGMTLDRIDVNGNYCPENCRWADATTQANNKRKRTKVEASPGVTWKRAMQKQHRQAA